jgi:hypothetical protein
MMMSSTQVQNSIEHVVNESQIRLVIRTFKDRLPEISRGRKGMPEDTRLCQNGSAC